VLCEMIFSINNFQLFLSFFASSSPPLITNVFAKQICWSWWPRRF